MSRRALVPLAFVALVMAQDPTIPQFPATPLVSQIYPHPTDLPYQVYPGHTFQRGPQTGYNICNTTTENQDSMCQTLNVNDLADFCLWAPPHPNSTIGDTEAEEVAWCTKKGHGSRIMLDGTLLGVQVLNTPDYTMITGLIDQTKLNIQAGDYGGECDSGGQDLAGNPIGGMLYSTDFATDSQPTQVNIWTEFIGNGQFCIKICNPNGPGKNAKGFCQHTLDRIGVAYNCPSKYTLGGGSPAGEFEVCDSDNMQVPGIYTLPGGTTTSYAQPPESLGPIQTVPYDPSLPPSSNCRPTASSLLYTDLIKASATPAPSGSGSGSSSGGTTQPTSGGAGASGSAGSSRTSGSSGPASPTGAAESGIDSLHVSVFAAAIGTLVAVAMFM